MSYFVLGYPNIHLGGGKPKPFSMASDFTGLIFTGQLPQLNSAGVLKQGVFFYWTHLSKIDKQKILVFSTKFRVHNCVSLAENIFQSESFIFENVDVS